MSRAAGQQGFTLVEMLVAMTVLGLILAGVAGVLRTGGQASLAQRDSAMRMARMETLSRVLRDLLAQVELRGEPGSPRQVAFELAPTRLGFVARLPPYPSYPGPHWVTLAAEQGAGSARSDLVLTVALWTPDGIGERVDQVVLVPRIDRLRLDAVGVDGVADGTPAAVSLELTLDGRALPAIVAPLGRQLPVDCVIPLGDRGGEGGAAVCAGMPE